MVFCDKAVLCEQRINNILCQIGEQSIIKNLNTNSLKVGKGQKNKKRILQQYCLLKKFMQFIVLDNR